MQTQKKQLAKLLQEIVFLTKITLQIKDFFRLAYFWSGM